MKNMFDSGDWKRVPSAMRTSAIGIGYRAIRKRDDQIRLDSSLKVVSKDLCTTLSHILLLQNYNTHFTDMLQDSKQKYKIS